MKSSYPSFKKCHYNRNQAIPKMIMQDLHRACHPVFLPWFCFAFYFEVSLYHFFFHLSQVQGYSIFIVGLVFFLRIQLPCCLMTTSPNTNSIRFKQINPHWLIVGIASACKPASIGRLGTEL